MKRLSLLFTVLIASSTISAQSLDQSIWRVFKDDGSFYRYIQFANDSMYSSQTNGNYISISYYEENGTSIKLVDKVVSGGCNVLDTGSYTFQFKDDSVLFTYVQDSCYYRYEFMALFDWTDLASGLEEKLYDDPVLSVYPNPANDVLIINFGKLMPKVEYSISDLRGKLFEQGYLNSPESRIDVSRLPAGLYILSIDNNAIRKRIMIN
jgi:hypothetical protein